jgi:hypothetical protein
MEEVDTTAIRAGNLIQKADRPVVKKTGTRRARPQVEVYNGAKRSVTTF